jgi:hypothetical protein
MRKKYPHEIYFLAIQLIVTILRLTMLHGVVVGIQLSRVAPLYIQWLTKNDLVWKRSFSSL